jgi:hypothetical protein
MIRFVHDNHGDELPTWAFRATYTSLVLNICLQKILFIILVGKMNSLTQTDWRAETCSLLTHETEKKEGWGSCYRTLINSVAGSTNPAHTAITTGEHRSIVFKAWVRYPKRWMVFINLPDPSGRTRPWGFTQPLTEMSTRSIKIMFLGSKAAASA